MSGYHLPHWKIKWPT